MSNLIKKFDLIKIKLEILKMKANDHDWSCYVPKNVQEELEKMLIEIDGMLMEIQ